ncbi:hypothetical protein MsAc7_17670 [Methanolapillus millepedarum]|uniref:Uncharacterized protein n=2 Tax=Methanolapillus millepedarum TaxID=3028296 RepID=A0AA96ZV06_9EURY|nr:hypothetical protein MsAc7_17670 [Methanosarcinaceae archaeon Ac7]
MPIYPNVKEELELLYDGRCTVYSSESVPDKNGGETFTEKLLYENIACRRSSRSVVQAGDGTTASVQQVILLLIGAEYNIPPGSKIVITQFGKTETFTNSGEPDFHQSHQEIVLQLIDTKA